MSTWRIVTYPRKGKWSKCSSRKDWEFMDNFMKWNQIKFKVGHYDKVIGT